MLNYCFVCCTSPVQLDKSTVPTLQGIKVWPVCEQREMAAENWGGVKKPVLISCGLVFPAGFSTERGAAAVARGDQSKARKNVTPTTTLFLISIVAYFYEPLSVFFFPVLFPFWSTFSSCALLLLHMFRAASKLQCSLVYYLACSLGN